jgi:hypothetical protein
VPDPEPEEAEEPTADARALLVEIERGIREALA